MVGVLADLSSFLVIFSYIVPISLYTTLGKFMIQVKCSVIASIIYGIGKIEVQKFTSSLFFAWDLNLYHAATDEPAICNTSDLNEELGQVKYIEAKSLKRYADF